LANPRRMEVDLGVEAGDGSRSLDDFLHEAGGGEADGIGGPGKPGEGRID